MWNTKLDSLKMRSSHRSLEIHLYFRCQSDNVTMPYFFNHIHVIKSFAIVVAGDKRQIQELSESYITFYVAKCTLQYDTALFHIWKTLTIIIIIFKAKHTHMHASSKMMRVTIPQNTYKTHTKHNSFEREKNLLKLMHLSRQTFPTAQDEYIEMLSSDRLDV